MRRGGRPRALAVRSARYRPELAAQSARGIGAGLQHLVEHLTHAPVAVDADRMPVRVEDADDPLLVGVTKAREERGGSIGGVATSGPTVKKERGPAQAAAMPSISALIPSAK